MPGPIVRILYNRKSIAFIQGPGDNWRGVVGATEDVVLQTTPKRRPNTIITRHCRHTCCARSGNVARWVAANPNASNPANMVLGTGLAQYHDSNRVPVGVLGSCSGVGCGEQGCGREELSQKEQDGDERTLGVTGGRVEQHCRTDFCVPKTSRGNPLLETRKRDFLKFLKAERNAAFRESVVGLVASLPRLPMYAKSTDVTLRKDGPY